MPSYDPQRSRARLRAPEDEPAPVDALLGDPVPPAANGDPAAHATLAPDPTPEQAADPSPQDPARPPDAGPSLPTEPLVVDLDPIAAGSSTARRRRWPLLVVAAMIAALQFLVWRWWRHHRRTGISAAP